MSRYTLTTRLRLIKGYKGRPPNRLIYIATTSRSTSSIYKGSRYTYRDSKNSYKSIRQYYK